MYQPPRVLAIHLDRFDKQGNKNEKSIKFDEALDLTRFITPTQLENDKGDKISTQYQLCGIISHQGTSSIHGGRFVSYVKSSNGMWYCLDNESVSDMNPDTLSTNARL
jgi:ubiquitin C-terminal hydrolase